MANPNEVTREHIGLIVLGSIIGGLVLGLVLASSGNSPSGSVSPPRTYDRGEVDRMFREIMEAENVPAWRRARAYAAVRVFGRGDWRG